MTFLPQRQQLGDGRRAGTVRQAAEHAIGSLGDLARRKVFEREVESAGERRMDFADGARLRSWRVVRAVILTSGWRSRILISSSAE